MRNGLVYLAAYGTLMQGEANPLPRWVQRLMHRQGPCRIPGRLYAIGPGRRYPGLVLPADPGDECVLGDLYLIGRREAEAKQVLRVLEQCEEVDPLHPRGSEFVRQRVMLKEPHLAAWVYLFNSNPEAKRFSRITTGNWKRYRP